MHDATEGGCVAALNEIADASNVGFSIDFSKLPLTQELQKLIKHFHLTHRQIMSMSSTGTLLAAVSPNQKDRIIDMLSKIQNRHLLIVDIILILLTPTISLTLRVTLPWEDHFTIPLLIYTLFSVPEKYSFSIFLTSTNGCGATQALMP